MKTPAVSVLILSILGANAQDSGTKFINTNVFAQGAKPGTLRNCEGDCDSSKECGKGLMCFTRGGNQRGFSSDVTNPWAKVPGCVGKSNYDWDYCVPKAQHAFFTCKKEKIRTDCQILLYKKPPTIHTTAPAYIVKAGHECTSKYTRVKGPEKFGAFKNYRECAASVKKNGGRYFTFGNKTGYLAGVCNIMHTKSAACMEGFDKRKIYDFYALGSKPVPVKKAPKVATCSYKDAASVRACGWTIGFGSIDGASVKKSANGGKYFVGFNGNASVGFMKMTMKGNGTATITYRNAWSDGNSRVDLLVDGKVISSAKTPKKYVTKVFNYKNGQVVQLRDEGTNSVVEVTNFTMTRTKPAPAVACKYGVANVYKVRTEDVGPIWSQSEASTKANAYRARKLPKSCAFNGKWWSKRAVSSTGTTSFASFKCLTGTQCKKAPKVATLPTTAPAKKPKSRYNQCVDQRNKLVGQCNSAIAKMKTAVGTLPVKQANKIIKMANDAQAKCKDQIAAMDLMCAKLKSGFKPSRPSANAYMIMKGRECKSKDQNLGTNFKNYRECAAAVMMKKGKFFIFGTGRKAGKCAMETTRSASCTEGWEKDSYNFYGVGNRPADVKPAPKPTGDNMLRNPCNQARKWHTNACIMNEEKARSYLKKMRGARRSEMIVDVARRSKSCRKQVDTINAACMGGFINDMKSKGCVLDQLVGELGKFAKSNLGFSCSGSGAAALFMGASTLMSAAFLF